MQHDAVTLYCPNDLCQAANSQNYKFCQRCRSPLIKRYLWAVGEGLEADTGLVGDRYLLRSHRIFLDTKPGLLPESPAEISGEIESYLRLVPYRLHVPQIYGVLPSDGQLATEILLLEKTAIYTDAVPLEGQLMPELFSVWREGTSMRQLSWLWQIAQLWQPCSTEGVAASLLEPAILRVEGPLVRLLELRLDRSAPTLASLGQLWQTHLLSGTQQAIAGFLQQLCQQMIQGEVRSSDQLTALLDLGLAEVGRSQVREFTIATRTDTGPSRQRNEDACYPSSGTTLALPPEADEALTIVCDGIGGHDGGNIASNLAIETIQQQVQPLILHSTDLDPINLCTELESSACAANDRISQRNDSEHRQGRQRMGTTLVMALARAHEIYITHVGDSRAYWITRNGCHQVTLDDDVASREVRLGYALYRDALQQVSSGSLVQALGMSASAALHPTVQRFILDEDCVFLLCSDGLSDYDRVEQFWETEILPILDGKVDLATAGARLVEIGNTENGHDNVTVGLVHCQVNSFEPKSVVSASLAQQELPAPTASSAKTTNVDRNPVRPDTAPSKLKTQLLPAQRTSPRLLVPVLMGILLLSLGSGLLAYLFVPEVSRRVNFSIGLSPSSSPSVARTPTTSASPLSPPESSVLPPSEAVSLSRVKSSTSASAPGSKLLLWQQKPDRDQRVIGFIPSGSVLHIIQDQTSAKNRWLQVQVCSTPKAVASSHAARPEPGAAPSQKPARLSEGKTDKSKSKSYLPVPPGKKGWISQAEIARFLESAGLGECSTLPPASQPTTMSTGDVPINSDGAPKLEQ